MTIEKTTFGRKKFKEPTPVWIKILFLILSTLLGWVATHLNIFHMNAELESALKDLYAPLVLFIGTIGQMFGYKNPAQFTNTSKN